MKLSKHALSRGQQRGITEEEALAIFLFGEEITRRDGAKEYRLRRRDVSSVISGLKRIMEKVHRAVGKSIIANCIIHTTTPLRSSATILAR